MRWGGLDGLSARMRLVVGHSGCKLPSAIRDALRDLGVGVSKEIVDEILTVKAEVLADAMLGHHEGTTDLADGARKH